MIGPPPKFHGLRDNLARSGWLAESRFPPDEELAGVGLPLGLGLDPLSVRSRRRRDDGDRPPRDPSYLGGRPSDNSGVAAATPFIPTTRWETFRAAPVRLCRHPCLD